MTFFQNIAKQRQALVNLMINITEDHLKSKEKEQMYPPSLPLEFRMGDKEVLQALPNFQVDYNKNKYYVTVGWSALLG